ncbi:thioredoxin family protein [Alkalihalobacillus sp. AL-G]|uniref:thioredoxin family protein n=1 Tax=Alkalihalobacillus sp. AL-G TaxID=2926399 RepID=UPI00272CF5B1|nr:thioredoxin family protein [Alkalihalobacillus sp. AL-G]WLD92725.1 thioredoxin family protein [Alkalihalobacillus sp. AL-G]
MVKEISQTDISKLQTSSKKSVVFFYTPLCGTCKLASQMLKITDEALGAESIELFECNLNLHPEMAVQWEIESVPCLLFISGGKVREKLYSFRSVDYIFEKLQVFFTVK